VFSNQILQERNSEFGHLQEQYDDLEDKYKQMEEDYQQQQEVRFSQKFEKFHFHAQWP
jgi:uncharacterized protein YdcH (DUF465 family)